MILLTASSAGLSSSCPVWVDLKLFRAFVPFFCCFFSPAHVIAESVHASRLRQKANNHHKQSSHFYPSPLISCYWSRIEARLSTWTSVLHIDIFSADKLNLRIGYFILRISSYSNPYIRRMSTVYTANDDFQASSVSASSGVFDATARISYCP